MKKSGGSWIVKKQNSIPGMVIFLQMVIMGLFAGSQSIAAQDKQASSAEQGSLRRANRFLRESSLKRLERDAARRNLNAGRSLAIFQLPRADVECFWDASGWKAHAQ